jgi:hypothetical protein
MDKHAANNKHSCFIPPYKQFQDKVAFFKVWHKFTVFSLHQETIPFNSNKHPFSLNDMQQPTIIWHSCILHSLQSSGLMWAIMDTVCNVTGEPFIFHTNTSNLKENSTLHNPPTKKFQFSEALLKLNFPSLKIKSTLVL